jgi:hypothetical protein
MGNIFSGCCYGYAGGVKLSSQDKYRIYEIVDSVNYLSCPCKFTIIDRKNGKRKKTVFNVNGGLTEESQSHYMIVQQRINKIRRFFCRPQNDLTEMGQIYFQIKLPEINEHISHMLNTSIRSAGNISLGSNDRSMLISYISKLSNLIRVSREIITSVDDIKNKVVGNDDLISELDKEKVCSWINSILKLGYVQTDTVMEDKDKQKYAKKWTKLQKRQQSIYFNIYLPGIYVPCNLVRIDDTGYGFMIEWDDSDGERQVMEYIPHDKHDE